MSQQLFNVAQCQHDAVLVLESHMAIGNVAFYLGDLVTARVHLEQSLGLWDTPQLPATIFSNGYESGVIHGFCSAMVLWLLGYADQAQQRSQETLALAQQLEHPPSLAYAQLFGALLSQFRRDAAATHAHTKVLMTTKTAQDFAFRVGQGYLLLGWALAVQEDTDAGIALIRQGLATTEGAGLKLYRPYFLALLAEAYGQAGEAEVWRLKGELLLRLPLPGILQATVCLHQALDVAHRQQATALELRATLSLSRLWQQGQRDQARQLLTEGYSWCTEGFETPDLQEARRDGSRRGESYLANLCARLSGLSLEAFLL